MTSAIRIPDISERPYSLATERTLPVSPQSVFDAWTRRFDLWFAAPGSVLMQGVVNSVFYFETEYRFEEQKPAKRHPHYGRFLQLVPNRLVQLTWVTGSGGTEGAETVVTVELEEAGAGTVVRLTHAGFASREACEGHARAWPVVLEHMEQMLVADPWRS